MKIGLLQLALAFSLFIGCSKSGNDNSDPNNPPNPPNPPTPKIVPGTLDSTFGINGKQIISITQGDNGQAVAIQSDGKIVAAGYVEYSNSKGKDFALVRLNKDGSVDNSFGSSGIVTTDFGSGNEKATSLVIQADGKIIVAGYLQNNYSAIARYNIDGSLDNSFGTGGKISGNSNSIENIATIAIQPDGKFIVAGSVWNSTTKESDFGLQRYNSNGTIDNTFGTTGKVVTVFGTDYDEIMSLVIQQNGKILVSGYTATSASKYNFALARYNSNGSLDNSFGTGGKVSTSVGSRYEIAFSSGVQDDGKIVAAGYIYNANSTQSFALVRYNVDGTIDNSFGSNGKVITDFGTNNTNLGRSLLIQPDGKLMLGGYTATSYAYSADFALVRYNPNGSVDSTYGINGRAATDFDAGWDEGFSIAQQPDGKIVAVGAVIIKGKGTCFGFARYK